MLKICLTFDYEIFFGKNYGTESEILFEPTDKLVALLEKEHIKATFFADTCSVLQNKKVGRTDYVKDFSEQIKQICLRGQDVQLHLHPNWLKSQYAQGEWVFDQESYRLHTFGFDRDCADNAYSIIRDGVEFLNETLRQVDKSYQCIAYRAGGFAIQPHEKLVEALVENGIRIDSSIAPGLSSASKTNYYDFKRKLAFANWWISPQNEWWVNAEEKLGTLYEVPIATENKNPIKFLIKRILAPGTIKLNLGLKRGTYINETSNVGKKQISYWNYISGYSAMSMDAYQAEYIYSMLKRYYRKHRCSKYDCTIALIGHPKLVTQAYIDNLKKLIALINNESSMEFVSIPQVYNDLEERANDRNS